jgi:hypothetical protein
MPRDAPVTIATFVLTGESRRDDDGRPSIVCTESILLSFCTAQRLKFLGVTLVTLVPDFLYCVLSRAASVTVH